MKERRWTVRGLTGTLVLLWASGGVFAQTPAGLAGNKPAASVNGEVITMAELEAALKQDGPMPVALPEAVRKQQQQVALSALIDEALLRQFLKQNTQPIDAKELEERLADLAAGLRVQQKSLADFCRERNQTLDQLKANLAAALQWRAYASKQINDQKVQQFYQENKDMFDKILVHAAEIMFHVPAQSGAAAREEYRNRLAQIRQKILNKEADFALMAKQYSQGPTREQGGDLDWFPHYKGVLPEPLLSTAFTLKPGEISDVLDSELGVHIIKVIDRKPGEPSDLNKIKEEVRQMCIEEMQQVVLQQLRQGAEIKNYLPR